MDLLAAVGRKQVRIDRRVVIRRHGVEDQVEDASMLGHLRGIG